MTASIVIAPSLGLVLRVRAIPDNVGELFLDHGSFLARLVFADALVWAGIGAVLAAGWVRRSAHRDHRHGARKLAATEPVVTSLAAAWMAVGAA